MITIYLGDVTDYLSRVAHEHDSDAQLITRDNFSNLSEGVYYTSLGEFKNLNQFSSVLRQANKIVYAPPNRWSDDSNGRSEMQVWTEDYLDVFKFNCDVQNYTSSLKFKNILRLADVRKTNKKQLWVAGCSVSNGSGVDKNTRYGQLLANKLNLEVSFLTQGGGSIPWAADQILRSDIRSGDLVVWGLTSTARFSQFTQDCFVYNTVNTPKLNPMQLDFIVSDHVVYQSVTGIHEVINFCKKIKSTLVLAPLLYDPAILNYIGDFSNLIMLCGLWGRNDEDKFPDLGSDNLHPGIISHQFYADQIYQRLQKQL